MKLRIKADSHRKFYNTLDGYSLSKEWSEVPDDNPSCARLCALSFIEVFPKAEEEKKPSKKESSKEENKKEPEEAPEDEDIARTPAEKQADDEKSAEEKHRPKRKKRK